MFLRLGTQWRLGPQGVMGLDYNVLQWLISLYPSDNPQGLLEDLQTMEQAALAAMHNRAE